MFKASNHSKIILSIFSSGLDGGCDWSGELGHVYRHIAEKHRNIDPVEENAHEATTVDGSLLAGEFERCQIRSLGAATRPPINRSAASFSLEIPSEDVQGETNGQNSQVIVVSSAHRGTALTSSGQVVAHHHRCHHRLLSSSGYRSAREMIANRRHLSESLDASLTPRNEGIIHECT